MSAFVVVNPHSGGGRTGRAWPEIRHALESVYPHMTSTLTSRRGEAAALVREALDRRPQRNRGRGRRRHHQ